MANPTPGPYELYAEGHTIVVGDVATHTDLAEFFHEGEHTVSTSREEAEANARLFIAAPSLLAACKGLAALNRTPDRFASPELLAARAAIKEAEPPHERETV